MSKADNVFYKEFTVVLALIVLFGIAMFFLARHIGFDAHDRMMNSPGAIQHRITPVGQVRSGDPSKAIAAAPMKAAAPAAASAARSGAEVVQSACAACHMAGVAGAPKMGDKAAWEPRAALGLDTLVASVVNGKGAMPPKGGNPALSDQEIKAAVVHMLSETGIETAQGATAAEKVEAAATQTAEAAGQVVEQVAQAATAAAGQVAQAAATTAAAVQEQVAAVAAPAGAGPKADAAAGEAVANQACVACHAAGVAGAPKLGDKAAWEPRAALGFDALVSSVINGKGAMPPKGGAMALTEADIRNAVAWLLGKADVSAN